MQTRGGACPHTNLRVATLVCGVFLDKYSWRSSIRLMQLKILSWNIWLDGDLDAAVEFIKTANADIIGLQEVIPEREPNIIRAIEKLGYESTFSSVIELREDGKKMGNAIFSRHRITNTETHVLYDTDKRLSSELERRVAIQVDIRVNDTALYIFSTHLAHTHQKQSDIQDQQVENLIKLLPHERTIVTGDFNATPDSGVIKRMRQVMNDSDPGSGPTWSVYPEGCRTCNPQAIDTRLDYIFASRDLKTHSPAVGNSKASDHLPVSVVAEI